MILLLASIILQITSVQISVDCDAKLTFDIHLYQTTFAFVIAMEKNGSYDIIKHFYMKKLMVAQVRAELDEVRGDSASVLKTVYF